MGRYLNAVSAGFDNNNSLTSSTVRDAVAAQAIAGNYEGIEFDPGEYNFSDGGWTIPAALSLVSPRPNGARFNIGGELLLQPRVSPTEFKRAFFDFSLWCTNPSNDTHGLRVQLTAPLALLSRSQFLRVEVRGFGKQGICLDNTVNNPDGLFLLDLHNCISDNGFKFIRIGDSIRLENSQAHSWTNPTLRTEISGVLLQNPDGSWPAHSAAHMSTIKNCSMTTRGGGILMTQCTGWVLDQVFFEHPGYLGGALGTPLAQVELGNCLETTIKHCAISVDPAAVAYNIIAYGATDTLHILRNKYPNKGTAAHIYAPPTTNKIVVHQIDETYLYVPPHIVLQGTNSRVVT